jgi:hypothetical protein
MAEEPIVLTIPGIDDDNPSVLLHVEQHKTAKSWRLNLTATDGSDPFSKSFDKEEFLKLKAKNYHGSDADLEAAIRSVLLQEPNIAANTVDHGKIEVFASLVEGKCITVLIRKQVGEISVRF